MSDFTKEIDQKLERYKTYKEKQAYIDGIVDTLENDMRELKEKLKKHIQL